MNLKNTQFFMIESHGGKFKKKTLESFSLTTKEIKISDIVIIKEKKTRENTLNFILKKRDISKDLFIFVDDLIFLKDWYKSLDQNIRDGVIIGFSMLNKDGKTIQDFGYDLIKLDDKLSSRGLFRGERLSQKKLPKSRICAAVCGCAMWISKKVLNHVKFFPLEGQNRWGEMIFSNLAKKKGFETIVLSSHLIHYGSSTKIDKNPILSSDSWLIEKKMWNKVSSIFFNDISVSKSMYSRFSKEFISKINSSQSLLVYGCGTISEYVTNNILKNKKFHYASVLPEEIGKKINNKVIKNFNKINLKEYDKIFISSVGYENKILKFVPQKFRNKIICIKKSHSYKYINYSLSSYKKFL